MEGGGHLASLKIPDPGQSGVPFLFLTLFKKYTNIISQLD